HPDAGRAARCGPPSDFDREKSTHVAKFLFIYRSDKDTRESYSPEEMQRAHEQWQAWIKDGIQKGWMLDAGNGLKTEGRIVNAKKVVTDGPFVEAKDVVGGYAIVQADSINAAAEFAKGCPILSRGGSVEVRPFWEVSPGNSTGTGAPLIPICRPRDELERTGDCNESDSQSPGHDCDTRPDVDGWLRDWRGREAQ